MDIPSINSEDATNTLAGTLVFVITQDLEPIIKALELSKRQDLIIVENDKTKIKSLHFIGKKEPSKSYLLSALGINYFYDITDFYLALNKIREEKNP